MRHFLRTADEASVQRADRLAAFWVVLWAVVGVLTSVVIWRIAGIGDTISTSGQALDSAGQAINTVADVPFVGNSAGDLAKQIVGTSGEIQSRGQEVKGELHQLSILLGIFLILAPILPVLGIYIPARRARGRERAEIRGALAAGPGPGTQASEEILAHRALEHLSFAQVLSLDVDPADSRPAEHTRRLADAELSRLGLSRA